jgi:hypothetical protein
MNRTVKTGFWVVIFTFIFSTSVVVYSASAQRPILPPPDWDTAKNPHDFILDYYYKNGIMSKLMVWRRTGSDGLSVWGKSSNPIHNPIRVIVTVPAYDQSGQPKFWYPLGEFDENAFMDTEQGFLARELARMFPMYVFPDEKYVNYNTIAGTRQAPLIDNTWGYMGFAYHNPLGLRQVYLVNYTAKAHSREAAKMMDYMAKKNGVATDKMPLIKGIDDIQLLLSEQYITLDTPGEGASRGHFAVAPLFADPTGGVIAKDAFLWMSSRDGVPLQGELMFVDQFKCLQYKGVWCEQ